MIPFILGAIGLIAYGLSEKETEQKSSKKSYSKGLPAKIKWDKKNNIYGKSVGSKFLKISKSEFDSLYNDAHEGYYYQANAQLKGGVMTYTLRSIHSKTKMEQGGDLENKYQVIIDNNWDNPMFFDTLISAKNFAIKNTKKSDIEIIDFSGDSVFIEKGSSKDDFDWLFSSQMAKGGGMVESQIDALYKKSGFINDDYNWESKLLEMLQDSSMEAYQIYQKLTAKQKKDVLEEHYASWGQNKIVYGKKYANGGNILGFEAIVKKALKENNKWHFISEDVDGKNVQLKMYVGAKEVDVQIFKINGIHHGKMNYQNKTKTLAMIMGELK